MQATRVEVAQGREGVPLVVRARFERTFFGLGAFAGLALLLGGTYLMAEAMVDPLKASDVGVLVAGVALALSSFVLVYFVLPQRRISLAKREHAARHTARRERPVLAVYGKPAQNSLAAKAELSIGKDLPGPM